MTVLRIEDTGSLITKGYLYTYPPELSGGRNLVADSDEEKPGGDFVDFLLDLEKMKALQGKTVTVSFEAKDVGEDGTHKIDFYFRSSDAEGGIIGQNGTFDVLEFICLG